MASKIQKLRHQAFCRQQGCCFYCLQPLWEKDLDAFVKTHGIRKSVGKHLQCTAEHLRARRDKGCDARENIAAACLWCNARRHYGRARQAPTPEIYQANVRALVAQGKWHPVAASLAARKATVRGGDARPL